uniref:SprT-like domain-containing protein n=1 Tax=Ditylenchus dipsaci TaxID=166011 RepID=A0A915DRQ0_9BILA
MGSKKLMLRIFVAKTITRHSPQVGSRKHECNALTYHFGRGKAMILLRKDIMNSLEDYVNGLVHELTHVAAYATNKHKMHDNRWWKDPFEPILWNNFGVCLWHIGERTWYYNDISYQKHVSWMEKVAAFESITELHDWDFQTATFPRSFHRSTKIYAL